MNCWTTNFCINASEGPFIIIHQLKFVYNSPFKDSHSHPIHTCLSVIASNVADLRGGGATDTWGPNSFIFMQFSANNWENNSFF